MLAQVRGDGLGVDVDNVLQQVGPRVRHPPHRREIGAASTFNHVASERKWTAGKADQRNGMRKCALDFDYRVEDIAQLRHVGHGECADRRFIGRRTCEARAFSFGKRQSEAHRIGNRQDVGKKYGGVERVTRKRLQRYFGGE